MNTVFDAGDIVKRAHAVSTYYGFSPLALTLKGRKKITADYPESVNVELLDPYAREIAGFLKRVRDTDIPLAPATPLFLWHTNAAHGRPSPKTIIVQFHALSTDRAIADAVLIRAMRALALDIAKTEPTLRINSMGDKETRARFSRELTSFFRKRAAFLPPETVERARHDVLSAARMVKDLEGQGLPSATDHLSENSRKHFESLLEYLEATETSYELAPEMVSASNAWSETCFEITAGDRVQVFGSRYTDLAKSFLKNISGCAGAVLKVTPDAKTVIPPVKQRPAPRFVFVHIGDEAKRVSIRMADTLRHARIPLTQVLGIESLTEQMRYAEELNPRYLLIMGRKEALERSVILRERQTHTETFIPLDSLVEELKAVA